MGSVKEIFGVEQAGYNIQRKTTGTFDQRLNANY